MKKLLNIGTAIFGLFFGLEVFAQPMLPAPGPYLDSWSFYDSTNWLSDLGDAPIAFTNLENVTCWASGAEVLGCNALLLDSTNPAILNYRVVETGGGTNLVCPAGTLWFWFSPDWSSASQGGAGPGDWGRFIDVGAWTSNASYGWWSLYLSPGGDTVCFSGQTNGLGTNYLSCPVSWTNGSWHFIGLTYTATNSMLYVDGQLATNGLGVSYWPGHNVLTNGFFIGSDGTGLEQARGRFVDVETYSSPYAGDFFSNDYAGLLPYVSGGGGSGGGSTNSAVAAGISMPAGMVADTNLWLWLDGVSSNLASLALVNTGPDILYELQGRINLAQGGWISEGFVYGSELTNWTPMSVLAGKQGSLFLRLRSWVDSNNSGIPDWWWLAYFGQTTNVNAYADPAGDNFNNLYKFQNGLNPTNYYNPNGPPGFFGCLDASGTNAFLEWSNAPGPVIHYVIQRGLQDTNGNYVYSQIGLVSSNATFFEDVGAITNANAQNNQYTLAAVYPGGVFSATNTWTVWWYPNYGSYGPPFGPPLPGNVYAYASAAGTNVLLSWTPASSLATNYLISYGIYNPTNYAYQYTQITNVSLNTTSFEVFGALTNGSDWIEAYEVQAVYPGGGLSFPVTTLPDYYSSPASINVGANTNGPAAPGNFYGYPDATGTNIFLTWSPVSGAVTNYILYGGVPDPATGLIVYQQLGKVGSGTNIFEVNGAIDGSGNNLYYIYNVVAVYANGSLSQSAAWYPGNGAPAPGALSAYLDWTGTNVVLAWTPAQGTVTGYLLQVSDYYGESWSYYQLANVSSATFSFTDVNGVGNAGYGLDAVVYAVQAAYPNGGLSPPVTAAVATNAPAPGSLTATVDATGTNAFLAWTPAVGVVTGYTILRGTYNASTGNYSYSTIGTVGAGTTSFEDAGAITSQSSTWNRYEVIAQYAGGSASAPVAAALAPASAASSATVNLNVSAQMVRNETGHWQLMFSGIPAKAQTLLVDWCAYSYFYQIGATSGGGFGSFDDFVYQEAEVPVSSLTNGVYAIPDWEATNYFPNNAIGVEGYVRAVDAQGNIGNPAAVGFLRYDSPTFVDARQHLKQNLRFELRAATASQPNVSLVEQNVYASPFFQGLGIPAATNYVESSIFHWSQMANISRAEYIKMDDVWPVTVNYQLHAGLYDPDYAGTNFVWQPNLGDDYVGISTTFEGTLATIPAPAVLGIGDPYWISQGLNNLAEVAAYTNSGNLYLQSGEKNLFGLAFTNALVKPAGLQIDLFTDEFISGTNMVTLAPGSSTSMDNVSCFFSQTADPSLSLNSYYFAPVNTPGTALPDVTSPNQPDPIPALTGFANTNQTPIMIASVGTPAVIGGWAKFSIQNGSPGKFAYLGQYYLTNAYVVTNGIVTTNTTGVVSPYGDFFPTDPGQVALVTLPDLDTGQQGTGVVDVISLNADANHDGTMDFSYQGPDQTSPSRPFRFWVNDVNDAGDVGGDGIPGGNGSKPDGMISDAEGNYSIQGSRNLVNFFPVYLNLGSLFQSNVLSAGISVTDTNYQFVLSQADGALRFAYTDLTPANYMNFLQDTNEVFNYLHDAPLTTVSNLNSGGAPVAGYFLSQIAGNHGGIILVEAWENTTQPLVLTIYHGTNQLAQTSLYLSISGVEQMFRSKTMLLNSESGMVPDRLTDADVPNEPDTTDVNFIFVHGYNVNPQQARGWDADMFKRLYWSGSHAKFYGVTWEAADTQVAGQVTINLQTNIVNAFNTAPLLNTFLNSLPGTNVVAAHSLGNMLVLSTLNDYGNQNINTYFMIDAAVAMEAIQGNAVPDANMYYPDWIPYADKLNASDWWQLFPTNDARSTLTWNNRLANFGDTEVYNFYSSGEEVLREYTNGAPPGEVLGSLEQVKDYFENEYLNIGEPVGAYAWAWEEMLKGRGTSDGLISSTHGGWKFNFNPPYLFVTNGLPAFMSPSQASSVSNSQLQTNAFFDVTSPSFGTADLALFGASGNTYAQTHRNRILSDAIPAITLPIGANPVSILGATHNFNMSTNTFENSWPVARLQQPDGSNWHHSDCRQVAYTFTYQLFNNIVTIGELK